MGDGDPTKPHLNNGSYLEPGCPSDTFIHLCAVQITGLQCSEFAITVVFHGTKSSRGLTRGVVRV